MSVLNLQGQSIEILVTEFQLTKEGAIFEKLYISYYKNLFLYCLKITNNKDAGYDIATDSFIQAIEKIHQLNTPKNFPSWLFRIAHNNCINHLSALQKNRFLPIEECYNSTIDNSQAETLASIEKEALLIQMETSFNKLEPMEKEILSEKYLNGKSLKDLEQQYNLSSSAVKMRLSRAKNKVVRLSELSNN